MAFEELIVKIGASADNFEKELDSLKSKTKSFEKSLANVAKISGLAFAGLSAAVGVAVKDFTNFEKTFTNVQTLLDKSSFSTKTLSEGIRGLKNDVLTLGASTGESFDNLNKGLFDLISAGVPAAQATEALKDAVNLATAGATDTAIAVKALTSAYTAYGAAAGSTAEISQKFFTAQKFGVTTVGELAQEFNKVGGLSKQLGINFNEALAAATSLTANGAKPTAQAFTEFRAVLNSVILAQSRLKNESAEVQAALSLQNVESKGIVGALTDLKAATGGNVVTLQRLLGSTEALSGALSLTGAQAGLFKTIVTELNDEVKQAAVFQEALATKNATVDKSIARAKESFNALSIQIGERFAPLIIKVADGIQAVAIRFNNLSDEQKDAIAGFLKAGVVITGVITGITTFGLVAIKAISIIKALRIAFAGARIAAGAFISTATLGLGSIIAFLPEIISGVKALTSLFSKEEKPKTLTAINKELDELKKKQDVLNSVPETDLNSYSRAAELSGIEEEIKKLDELKKKQLEAENLKSDGSILLRPEAFDPIKDFEDSLKGKSVDVPVNLPEKATQEIKQEVSTAQAAPIKDDSANELARKEQEKTAIIDAESQKRIQAAKNENEILKAEAQNLTTEEIGFIKQRQELKAQQVQVQSITDAELRAIELENIALKNDALIAQEQEFQARKMEEKLRAQEEQKALDLVLNELTLEERALFNEKELEDLRNQILSKREIENEEAKEKALKRIQDNNQFLKDRLKFGETYAKINQALNSDEVKQTQEASNQLIQLQGSKNQTLKTIGQTAARAQIAIDTARGAMAAYSSLAGIPIVGPALGIAAGAAVVAYGAERLQAVGAAQRGGFVPNASGGTRDRVPMMLEPNELVVPKALAPDFIQAVGRPDAQATNNEGTSQMVSISIEDDATDFITAKQRENNSLSIGVA